MIHHISIEANDPLAVAKTLAELMGGRVLERFPFGRACSATSGDEHGTMVECWPMALRASDTNVTPRTLSVPSKEHGFHVALSVNLSEDQITSIAISEGWETKVRPGGSFSVVEVWIENRIMFEFLSPVQTEKYLRTMS